MSSYKYAALVSFQPGLTIILAGSDSSKDAKEAELSNNEEQQQPATGAVVGHLPAHSAATRAEDTGDDGADTTQSFTSRLGSAVGKQNPLALGKGSFTRFQSAKSFRVASPGMAFRGKWKSDGPNGDMPWLSSVLENATCAMTVLRWGG